MRSAFPEPPPTRPSPVGRTPGTARFVLATFSIVITLRSGHTRRSVRDPVKMASAHVPPIRSNLPSTRPHRTPRQLRCPTAAERGFVALHPARVPRRQRADQVRFTEGQRLSDSVASGVLRATFPRRLIDEATEATARREQWTRELPARLVPHYVLAMTPFSSGPPASRKCRAEPDRGSGVVLRRCRRPRTPFEVAISKARIRLRSQHIVRPRTQTARQSPGRRSRPCPSGAPGSTDRSCRHSPGVVPLTGWCPARGQPLVSEFNRQSCPSAVSAG